MPIEKEEEKKKRFEEEIVKKEEKFKEELLREATQFLENPYNMSHAKSYIIELKKVAEHYENQKTKEAILLKDKVKKIEKKIEDYENIDKELKKLLKIMEKEPLKYSKLIIKTIEENKKWEDIKKELDFIENKELMNSLEKILKNKKIANKLLKKTGYDLNNFLKIYVRRLETKKDIKYIEMLKGKDNLQLAKEIEQLPKIAKQAFVEKTIPSLIRNGMINKKTMKLLLELLNKIKQYKLDEFLLFDLFNNWIPKFSKLFSDLKGITIGIAVGAFLSKVMK